MAYAPNTAVKLKAIITANAATVVNNDIFKLVSITLPFIFRTTLKAVIPFQYRGTDSCQHPNDEHYVMRK
ncbi:hypothetical protein AU511_02755 [Lonsdalea iberica]|uniref:Uncharacterized protein n=1 Tax=Lonsdalea iberica TaxID=1082703 RepID=A0A1X3S017_9GAMM|nr:hypothetical protein AU511_02755 [Lonsdalea iberica]